MSTRAARRQAGAVSGGRGYGFGFLMGVCVFGVILLLVGSSLGGVERFMQMGWPADAAMVIAETRTTALVHALILLAVAVAGLWGMRAARPGSVARRTLAITLLAVVCADAIWLSRHYVQTMPPSYIESNEVVEILKRNPERQRTAMLAQQGFYNLWLTYLLPYHNIQTFNFTQMPRMASDYSRFLSAMGSNPFRMWRLFSVGYILTPGGVLPEIDRVPDLKGQYDAIFAYNVVPLPDGNFRVTAATQAAPGQHVILRPKQPAPRYALLGAARSVSDDEALGLLADPSYTLFQEALVAADQQADVSSLTKPGLTGQVRILSYQPGRVTLRIDAPHSALLRISEKYDPDWRAQVSGVSTPVYRVDYLFQGVPVPVGIHTVELVYRPSRIPLAIQLVSFLVIAGAVAMIIVKRKDRPRTEDTERALNPS